MRTSHLLALLASTFSTSLAQPHRMKARLSTRKALVKAAEAAARRSGWAVSLAVADEADHLDYCFASQTLLNQLQQVKIGGPAEWLQHSDYVPVMVSFADALVR